ncbi:hypothetical protein GCM10020254_00590 [Streptomyces goshikiensis]
MTQSWAETGYRPKAIAHGARLRVDVEVLHRDAAQKGSKVIPRLWVTERTFDRLAEPGTTLPPTM